MSKGPKTDKSIAQNRKARHDYIIEKTFEAGIELLGWEVKALRAGNLQMVDSYVVLNRNGEASLIGCQIQPLNTASTHVAADPNRTRKLLLNRRELDQIAASVEQRGHTCVALSFQWSRHLVKVTLGLAKGKNNQDKRNAERERDANKQIQQATKSSRYD